MGQKSNRAEGTIKLRRRREKFVLAWGRSQGQTMRRSMLEAEGIAAILTTNLLHSFTTLHGSAYDETTVTLPNQRTAAVSANKEKVETLLV